MMKRLLILAGLLMGGVCAAVTDEFDSSVPFYYTVNGGEERIPLPIAEATAGKDRVVVLKYNEGDTVYTNFVNTSFRLDSTKKVLYWARRNQWKDRGWVRTLDYAPYSDVWCLKQDLDPSTQLYPRLVLNAEPEGVNVAATEVPSFNTTGEDPRALRLGGTVDAAFAGLILLATLTDETSDSGDEWHFAFDIQPDGVMRASLPLPSFLGKNFHTYALTLEVVDPSDVPADAGLNYALTVADTTDDAYGPQNQDLFLSPNADGHVGLRSVLRVKVNPEWTDGEGRKILEYSLHNMWKEYDDTYRDGVYGGIPADDAFHLNRTRECTLYPRTFLTSTVRCSKIRYVHAVDNSEVAFTGVANAELARRKVSVTVTNARTQEAQTYAGKVGEDLLFKVAVPTEALQFLGEQALKTSLSTYLVAVEVEKKTGFKIVIR